MKELKAITYRGVTSFYYKQDLRKIDKPPDAFWRTEEPFLYTERSKGAAFRCSTRASRESRSAELPRAYQTDLTFETLIARRRLENALVNRANGGCRIRAVNRQPETVSEGSSAMCEWIQKEARHYLRQHRQTEESDQKLNYNARYTNHFYGTISDRAERRFEDMEADEKVYALAFKLQTGKNYVREMLHKTGLLNEIADEQLRIKAYTIARKADLLKRRILASGAGVF